MPLVTLLSGPTAVGKTTMARALEAAGAVRLSMDEAEWDAGYRDGFAPRPVLERLEVGLQRRMVDAVAAGRPVVVDLSLTTRAVRDAWRAAAEAAGASVDLVALTAPIEVLWARMQERVGRRDPNARTLDRAALEAYVASIEPPHPDERARIVVTG
ncbi:AAA family ATPase [Agrococcus sp. SGAir0287]|uniref:AAA family ATPase n=1 Tax=Agrococcus sp. SGAir0287 TaxID=2070347 RepID=UPI0010CD2EF9|nr:AAA family ATPase [Agrococcus sp. SGAir0287]QCR19691.1 ATP-binding protein [Agrococcus sp. SGAir0287]